MYLRLLYLFITTTCLLDCQDSKKPKIDRVHIADKNLSENSAYKLHYDPLDNKQALQLTRWLNKGQKDIGKFFNSDFKRHFDVYLFSDRDSLDEQWQKDWNMPGFKSQCWMVASGIAHRLDLLSPRVWESQACEHKPNDTIATKKLILHELVHVFHGQHNPSPTFENVENIDWLVEGLAVYASGQLDQERYQRARQHMLTENGPLKLADIWKGEHKYGLAGSMVKLIDDTYGRKTLIELIGFTNVNDVLHTLNRTEEELIDQWKRSFL